MNRANRLSNDPGWKHKATACDDGNDHRWEAVGLSPHAKPASAYFICDYCCSWTMADMEFVGYALVPERDREEDS